MSWSHTCSAWCMPWVQQTQQWWWQKPWGPGQRHSRSLQCPEWETPGESMKGREKEWEKERESNADCSRHNILVFTYTHTLMHTTIFWYIQTHIHRCTPLWQVCTLEESHDGALFDLKASCPSIQNPAPPNKSSTSSTVDLQMQWEGSS